MNFIMQGENVREDKHE